MKSVGTMVCSKCKISYGPMTVSSDVDWVGPCCEPKEKTMKIKYKYIHFEANFMNGYWECINNSKGTLLGYVLHDKQWNQFVFTQADQGIIFSYGCLLDIADFIKQLNK